MIEKLSMKNLEFSSPLVLDISITWRCNLFCRHCLYSCYSKAIEMDFKKIKDIIKEAKKIGVLAISINGGEPTLHPHFWNILKFIDKLNIDFILTTNGTTLNEKDLEKLSTLRNFSCLRVSLDSINREYFEWFRGVSNIYERVLNTIKNATKFNYQVNILTTVTRKNINEIPKIVKFAENYDVDAVNFFPMVPAGRGAYNKNLILNKKEFKLFLKKISILKEKQRKRKTKILTEHPLMSLVDKSFSKDFRFCPAGIVSVSIEPNGEVYPCPYFPVSCGNVFKESLIDIWKNNTLLKMLRDDTYLSEKCKRCVFKNSCRGGCRAFSYIKYGDITHVDPFCWI